MSLGKMGTYEGYGFQLAASSGIIAAGLAADAELFQFRFAKPVNYNRKLRVTYVELTGISVDATGFAAGSGYVDLRKVTAWSADGSGGTTVTPVVASNALRISQSADLLNGITARIATTAALTAGTKTVGAQALGNTVFGTTTTAGTNLVTREVLFDHRNTKQPALVLDDLEGLVLRGNVPATGTWRFGVTLAFVAID